VVDGRKTYDKSGRQRRGTGIPPQTGIGIREERKRVRASKRLLVGDGGNLLVGLATFSCLLAVASMSECVHFKETGHHHTPSESALQG
jgi:hypothetical protein